MAADSLLSPEEWAVYDHLSEAFNSFIKLDKLHAQDAREFAFHINALKNIIMSRPVARELVEKQFTGYVGADGQVFGYEEGERA